MQMDIDKKQTLTVSNIRNVNITNIMQDIIRDKSKTRNELSKKNHISLMTVKHIVDDLIEMGILVEKASTGNDVGRKPKALEIAESYGNIVCVNLTSVDEISFLIYDIYENLLDSQTVEFREGCDYKENLLTAIAKVRERLCLLQTKTVGIAVFVPSAYYEDVDRSRDIISTEDLWLTVLNSTAMQVLMVQHLIRVKYSKAKRCRDTWEARESQLRILKSLE